MVDTGRKIFIGGNWKSNGTNQFVADMCEKTLPTLAYDQAKVEVLVAPTMLHLQATKDKAPAHIIVAAQNCNDKGNGAFTGEISCEQLTDSKIKAVILGHSERRQIYGETSEIVARKVI